MLVVRKPCAKDIRSSRIFLTEKGKDQAKKVKTICLHADETVLDRLSPEQAEMVTNTLELLISAYEEDSDE